MANSNGKYKWNTNRLTYIEPNEYAGYNATKSNPDLPNGKQLSWNPEDLSMFVDLQVIIPRREDAGQESYKVRTDGTTVSMDSSLYARYVSYMGGTNLREDNPKAETYITDNYTNISYQEVRGNKVVDKESLGIDSIDINFDAHFFPLVTMHFTDVRGSSLFMPSEEEFFQSVTNNDRTIEDTPSSFFKALFHFPYPRFLLSVKGFYGTKVTFQLAVSDFRSDFQPETGNYGITVKFIGYVYGLYTDLPFNLIMAAPYYNSEYWDKKINDGTFRYVNSGGQAGGKILKYVDFLSRMERKEVDSQALEGAELAQSYIKAKKAIEAISAIPSLYRAACECDPFRDDNHLWYTRRKSTDKVFVWGNYNYQNVKGTEVTESNQGFHFNTDVVSSLYDAIQNVFKNYPEYKSIIEEGNIFLSSFYSKSINGVKMTSNDIVKDEDGKHKLLFSYLSTAKLLTDYFEFYPEGAPIINSDNSESANLKALGCFTIKDNSEFMALIGNDDLKNQPILQINGELSQKGGKAGDELYMLNNKDNDRQPLDKGRGIIINVTEYCNHIQTAIDDLDSELTSIETEVAEDLKVAYQNIIGFEPTIENYYRMLFAHIDCFFDYYTNKILKQVKEDYDNGERTIKALGISTQETDLPKRIAKTLGESANVFPYPAYYTKHGKKEIKVADYPGYAKGPFSLIPEVDAVDNILKGLKDMRFDYEDKITKQSSVDTQNIFSPLSVLYNFDNPWETIKLTGTDNELDIVHIIYYYICLLYADKITGVNTERQANDNVRSYKQQMAGLLWKVIGENTSSEFGEKLKAIIATIKETDGLKYLENSFKDKYKLYNITIGKPISYTSNGDVLKITTGDAAPLVTNDKAALKIDDDILTKPLSYLSNNQELKQKYFVTGGDTDNENLYQAFSGNNFLSEYDDNDELLADFNNALVQIGEGRNYLNNKKTSSNPNGSIDLGEYSVSLLLEQPYSKILDGVKRPFVGINGDYKIALEIERIESDGGYSAGGYRITKNIQMQNTGSDTYSSLLAYYSDGTIGRHINFVGRKQTGITEFGESAITQRIGGHTYLGKGFAEDAYPSTSLFSGSIEYYKESDAPDNHIDNPPTWEVGNGLSDLQQEEYMGLLYTGRCIPWLNNGKRLTWDELSDEQKKNSEYAFATYMLASLCGKNNLLDTINLFQRGINRSFVDIGDNANSYVVRECELLYLGGSLYFAKNGLNHWSDTSGDDKKYKVCDLILTNGTLGGGLLMDKVNRNIGAEKLIDGITNPIFDVNFIFEKNSLSDTSIGDYLIDKFENWCDDELFGGKEMYNKLSKVVNEDDDDYLLMNGYFSDDIDTSITWANLIDGRLSLVQGFKTGGECERWLTNLAYSYKFAITFHLMSPQMVDITKSDVTDFLEELYKPIQEKEAYEEEIRRKLEAGDTSVLSQDQKRALYYLLKNLYDKWLCTYKSEEFQLHSPERDLEIRRNRFSKLGSDNDYSEYNNFIYIDQFYRDISSSFIMDSDIMAKMIKDTYTGRENMDIYTFMSLMAEKNKLMLLALPVYTNMYNSDSVEQVFKPNTLYNMNDGDNRNGVGTTYVIMYTSEVSHKPGDFGEYDYDSDYIDVADLAHNTGGVDLEMFNQSSDDGDNLNYNVTAFGVSYGKQNQMYFKKVNVNMDNPKTTDESIRNMLILADGGSQGDTNQPIAIGQNMYSIYSNRSYTCTVEMMGCMNIMPLMYFQLNNIPMFRGLYMIINVKHTVKAGDITTTFTGVRVNRYSLPDITDIMLNSNIFNRIMGSTDSRIYSGSTAITVGGQIDGESGKTCKDLRNGIVDTRNTVAIEESIMKALDVSRDVYNREYKSRIDISSPSTLVSSMEQLIRSGKVNLVPITKDVFPYNVSAEKAKLLPGLAKDLGEIYKEIVELSNRTGIRYDKCRLTSIYRKNNSGSSHSAALAVDLGNSGNNPDTQGSNMCKKIAITENTPLAYRTWDHPVVQIFIKHGWGWGIYNHRRDYMHFSYNIDNGGTRDNKGVLMRVGH